MARRNDDEAIAPGQELRERWGEIQFELIQGRYRRYAEVLRDGLTEWANQRSYDCEWDTLWPLPELAG